MLNSLIIVALCCFIIIFALVIKQGKKMKLNITISLGIHHYGEPLNKVLCYAEILPGSRMHDRQEFGNYVVDETKALSEVYTAIQETIERYNSQHCSEMESSDEDSASQEQLGREE